MTGWSTGVPEHECAACEPVERAIALGLVRNSARVHAADHGLSRVSARSEMLPSSDSARRVEERNR